MSTSEEVKAFFRAYQSGNRFMDVGEVAETVCFLVNRFASASNGMCTLVDLGALARS